MKTYKVITLLLIFAIIAFCAIKCIGQLSIMPYLYTIGCLCCGLIVLLSDNGKKECVRSK